MNENEVNVREQEEAHRITLGELRQQLADFPDEMELTFSCTRDGKFQVFNRVRPYGENVVLIELNELPL